MASAAGSRVLAAGGATIRPYAHGDLSPILKLWERGRRAAAGPDGLTLDQAVELMTSEAASALVALRGDAVVGVAIGSVTGPLGSIHLVTVSSEADEGELTRELIGELEAKLAREGARRLTAIVVDDGGASACLERCGYSSRPEARCLERELPADGVAVPGALEELGAHMIAPGLWNELRGFDEAKQVIERRVILPLAEPALAARHAVSPPKAIVLFGPPGTGKTTFAKGIASRLQWPFVEVDASEVAGEGPEREARLLAECFARVRTDLAAAVIFVDEVEDLAAARTEQRKVSPSITNEFLKQIPRMRELSEHLLVCATNWVSRLDPAFLRPGRFDYVLPVGKPDDEARRAIWSRYVEEITDADVDLNALVAASALFTPADIEFAARSAAQHAFEREHFEGRSHRATEIDFLAAIDATRPSLSDEILAGFDEDVERFARY